MQFQDWQIAHRLKEMARAYFFAGKPIRLEEHRHPLHVLALGSNSTSDPIEARIEEDALYFWFGLAAVHTNIGSVIFDGIDSRAMLRMTRESSGARFAKGRTTAGNAPDGWVPLRCIAGNGERPFIFPYPEVVKPSRRISFEIRDTRPAGAARNYYLTLLGVKARRDPSATPEGL